MYESLSVVWIIPESSGVTSEATAYLSCAVLSIIPRSHPPEVAQGALHFAEGIGLPG